MTQYRCMVLTADGRTDWRTLDGSGRAAVLAQLIAEGMTPLDIRSGGLSFSERLHRPIRPGGTLWLGEQALILNQLATLVRSGLPVDRSLDLIREQATRGGQRQLLANAVAQIRSGKSLSSSFEGLGCFPGYVIGVLRAAERGGDLGSALNSVADRLIAAASARQQLVTALSYPLVVLIATLMALLLVLTQVVPQFAPIFRGEENKLPFLTRMVLHLSDTINQHALILIFLLCLAFAIPILIWRHPPRLLRTGHYRRILPGLGLRDQYLSSQLIGLMGTLIRNGLPVASALPLTREALGSTTWRRALDTVQRKVREGVPLSTALATMGLLPSAAIRLIEVGERSGALADACNHASAVIAQAAKARLDRMIALANPIAIVLLGGLVGSLVAGVMLGIFSLGDFAG